MGLDMYLNARRFLWTSWGPQHRGKDDDVADAIQAALPEMGSMRPKYVEYYHEQTAYTRDRIRELLGNEDLASWDFQYHSSW